MPRSDVHLYRKSTGEIPLLEWLDRIPVKARLKCIDRISRLATLGNELRRPESDFLRDGIYELRASHQGVHYRILYFFCGRAVVVLSHGITKEQAVPPKEIERALERKQQVEEDFQQYACRPE